MRQLAADGDACRIGHIAHHTHRHTVGGGRCSVRRARCVVLRHCSDGTYHQVTRAIRQTQFGSSAVHRVVCNRRSHRADQVACGIQIKVALAQDLQVLCINHIVRTAIGLDSTVGTADRHCAVCSPDCQRAAAASITQQDTAFVAGALQQYIAIGGLDQHTAKAHINIRATRSCAARPHDLHGVIDRADCRPSTRNINADVCVAGADAVTCARDEHATCISIFNCRTSRNPHTIVVTSTSTALTRNLNRPFGGTNHRVAVNVNAETVITRSIGIAHTCHTDVARIGLNQCFIAHIQAIAIISRTGCAAQCQDTHIACIRRAHGRTITLNDDRD